MGGFRGKKGGRRGFRKGKGKGKGFGKAKPHEKSFEVSGGFDEEVVTARIEASELTNEQRTTAKRVLAGESLFVTGAAGTGKSFLLRYLIQELGLQHPGKIAVTAPTGLAAANIGGQTIHSFAGVGLGVGTAPKLVGMVKKSAQAVERWKKTVVLVVDEISMLDASLFGSLAAVAVAIRGVSQPFGGLQLLLCGDFLQLPPVQGRGEPPKSFCFESATWRKCGLDKGTVFLRESVRQSGDTSFAAALNEIREGYISSSAQALLAKCHVDVKPQPQDGIVATKLYCMNKDVDMENESHLKTLPGTVKVFTARDHFKGCDRNKKEMLAELMGKKVPSQLSLKVGAQVILLKNNPSIKLVNGSRGVVVAFQDGYPQVKFDTGRCVRIGLERFEQGMSSPSAIRIQVPLKLGWALTVHKAQGMTLSRAELQVDNAFEAGQSYVALSRLTSSAGLWIHGGGLNEVNTRAHETVLAYYRSVEKSTSDRPARIVAISKCPPTVKAQEVKDHETKKLVPRVLGERGPMAPVSSGGRGVVGLADVAKFRARFAAEQTKGRACQGKRPAPSTAQKRVPEKLQEVDRSACKKQRTELPDTNPCAIGSVAALSGALQTMRQFSVLHSPPASAPVFTHLRSGRLDLEVDEL